MLTYFGISALAILSPLFPCERFLDLSAASPRPALVALYGTFGTDFTCVNKFIKRFKDKPHLVIIHLTNEAGRRNNRLKAGELLPSCGVHCLNRLLSRGSRPTLNRYLYRANKITSLVRANNNTRLLIGTGLEDNYSNHAYKKLHKKLSHFPLIRNPLNPTKDPREAAKEDHGLFTTCSPTTVMHNDGSYIHPKDSKYLFSNHSDCLATIYWHPNLQGTAVTPTGWTSPRKRVFTIRSILFNELSTYLGRLK